MKSGYEAEIVNAGRNIQHIRDRQSAGIDRASLLKETASDIEEAVSGTEFTTAMVEKLIDRITVNDRKEIAVHFLFDDLYTDVCSGSFAEEVVSYAQ